MEKEDLQEVNFGVKSMSGTDVQVAGNIPNKGKRRREIVALFLFVLLLALGLFVISIYFGAAVPMNVAATKVDEAAGTMEKNSSIIYAGVLVDDDTKITSSSRAYTSDVRVDYLSKSASVVTIDLNEYANLDDLKVLKVGDKKIGIFALKNYCSKISIKKYVSDLQDRGADVVLCIAPRTNLLSTFEGVDAVLCTKPKSKTESDAPRIDNTFIFRAAEVGKVGVLSVSSSNVFIQNVIGDKGSRA